MNVVSELAVVIATYNRPESVVRMVGELQRCDPAPGRVIVVDSSDERNDVLPGLTGVKYLRSSHKNQPYQRFVGLLAARSEIVFFLDDDLFVEDPQFVGLVQAAFKEPDIVGVGPGLHYEGAVPPIFGGPRNGLAHWLLTLRAYTRRRPATGTIEPSGATGGFGEQDSFVQFFPGPAMSFRRKIALRLFDPVLFALYESGLGKGEDKALSMRANGYGRLRWIGRRCLRHPPTLGSHYAASPRRFLTKVLVSRLYLARVYCEVFGRPAPYAWLAFGAQLLRTLGSGLTRRQAEKGIVGGAVRDALGVIAATRLDPGKLAPGIDFWCDARRDVVRSGYGVRV